MEEVPLLGIIITLLFSAFFSGSEIAYLSSNRLKIELDKSKGNFTSKILDLFYRNESEFIAMLLLGNNISLVFFGLFSAELLEPIIHGWGIEGNGLTLLIQTVLSTGLVLVTAEFLPKAFVQLNPNGVLRYTAIPMLLIYFILYIPTRIVMLFSNAFLKLLKVENENSEKVFSKVDLEYYVQDMNSRIKEEEDFGNEMQILQNALDFETVKARECMVPRIDIISEELDGDIEDLRQKFIETGLSKIIIYRENIDNIIGYVHSFEMFKSPTSIKQILLPIQFVPEAKSGIELLELFNSSNGNIAVVVDEYGGTAGIVTIEDVIEEIFGEIEDEHDSEDLLEEVLGENEFLFSARHEIDYLNDEYGLNLKSHEAYESLGGFIIHHVENIPEKGMRIEVDNWTFEVEDVTDRRIDAVKVWKS